MFVVKGKTSASLHGFNTEAAPEVSIWTFQENGWMNDTIGEKWFRNVFLKNCGDQRPLLLILDGHSSHESLAILKCALANNLHILSLLPHITHSLQPLDRSVFGPFSAAYNAACSEFMSEDVLHMVNKWSFPGLIKITWEKSFTEQNIMSGFEACAIYPFNRHKVSAAAYAPSIPTDTPVCEVPVASSTPVLSGSTQPTSTITSSVAAVSSDDIPVSPLPMTSVSLVSTDISLSSPSISNNHVLASSHTSLSFPLLSDVSGRNLDSSDHEPPVIDDPELLLNLISSGQIDVISDSNTDTHESIWSSEIENMTNESFFLLFDVNKEKSCNFPSLNHEHGSSAGKAKYGKQETGKT